MEKIPIFDQNHGLTAFQGSQIFAFFKLLFFSLQRLYFFLEYSKTHFAVLFCLYLKYGKIANFQPNPGTNPFKKISLSQLFKILVFIA